MMYVLALLLMAFTLNIGAMVEYGSTFSQSWGLMPFLSKQFSRSNFDEEKIRQEIQEFLKDKTHEQKDLLVLVSQSDRYYGDYNYKMRSVILKGAILAGAHANIIIDGKPFANYLCNPVLFNDFKCIKFLLKQGADPRLPGSAVSGNYIFKKDNPIFLARSCKVAKLLIDHGLQPKNLVYNNGDNCIDAVVTYGHEVLLISLYAQHGVDVNGKSSFSPLHHLALKDVYTKKESNKYLSYAHELLKNGARTDLKKVYGKTVFQLVYERLNSSKTGKETKIYLNKLRFLPIKDQTYFSMLPEEINEMIFGMG